MTLPRRPLRVGLLENPRSGRNRRGGSLVPRLAGVPDLVPAVAGTREEMDGALAGFAREGVDCIAISGGDGTVHAVLTALHRHRPFATLPPLALLPSGTANMIAGDVGLGGERLSALRRLMAWAGDPERRPILVERAVLRVQPAPDLEPLYGMFFGAGAIYHGTRYCLGRFHPLGLRGRLGAGLTLVRYILALVVGRGVPSVAVTSAVDGRPAEGRDLLLLLATTLERLLLGLRPFWGVGEGNLRLTAVGARPRHLLRALPSLLRGRPGRYGSGDSDYVSRNAREVRLAFDGGCTLDGELLVADSRRGPLVLSDAGRVAFVRG